MTKIFKNLKKRDLLYILLILAFVVFEVWMELTMPDYTSKLSQSVTGGNVSMSDVLTNGGMMLLCALGSMVAAGISGLLAAMVAANFSKTLRYMLFGKVTDFSDTEMNRFSTPSLITRTTNDVVQIQMFTAMGLKALIKAPILAIWAICKISTTNMQWTSAILITVVVMVVAICMLVAVCYPKFRKVQKLTDNLNDVTRENISGVRVIRAFNAEDYQNKRFGKVNDDVTKNHLFTARSMGALMPIMFLCMNGLSLAIYWIGAYLINDAASIPEKDTLIGNMTAFTQYALQVVMAFMLLVAIAILLPRVMVSAKRIQEVLDTDPVIRFGGKGEDKADMSGELEFKNVSFVYGKGEAGIENISFKVNKGETLAIIGATGSGKTTIVNLIPRFYDVTGGQILLDGVDIREFSKEALEDRISIAPQKAILFKGDVKSNITYGSKEEVSDDDPRIKQALAISKADFVNELPDGIHAPVAQGGTNFSGGQKQRLSIARAVYKDAEIVIFDDTFSALDYKTDMLVRKSLKEQLIDTTVILVAQRIGTIKQADKIIVLEDGRIAGMGKHDELLQTCPLYKEIALSQLSKEEL